MITDAVVMDMIYELKLELNAGVIFRRQDFQIYKKNTRNTGLENKF